MAEKKGLHPVIAFVMMAVMVVCALFVGANRAWSERRDEVAKSLSAAEETIRLRVETAYNLSTVASRYMSGNDSLYQAVQQDLQGMENAAATLSERAQSCEAFLQDAKLLLGALESDARVQADSRDHMYVTLMLPQAVEQCANNASLLAYDQMAKRFNDGLSSFSGWLAQLTNVKHAEMFVQDNAQ